ncbi:uncharacterized protein B0P05DRAFT_565544 [Gilbertella persicaria]|uniref:uncharacterized protein n=1 Tax=Gilbertella persicaria TaxID=101096 RepID=UPI0022201632|nr:uncharacterized protein B0P05DRAFT_565544 [Gilbertella persicaria]KAI8047669.1 hypothetical protein B0P05DRAFT_565544 [Gilbertella persicaria]
MQKHQDQIPNKPLGLIEHDYFSSSGSREPHLTTLQSFQSLPPNNEKRPSSTRRGFNRFETAPQDGWKRIKKWMGSRIQLPVKQATHNLERQAEVNMITPLVMAMSFSRDENNARRMPIFLNSMTVRVTKEDQEDQDPKKSKFRGTLFKITVQYGTGSGKITWFVYRRYWDFVKLHYRYKTISNNTHSIRTPKFPSIPKDHFRKQKKISPSRQQSASDINQYTPLVMDEETVMALATVHEQDTPLQTPAASVISSQVVDIVKADQKVLQAMEDYLNQFIISIGPCGHTNRLCKFLEISALGMQLSAKYVTSYHGKEGYAFFQSRTDRDPRHKRAFMQDSMMCVLPTTGSKRRCKPKWFLVRDSYIVCVDDPSQTEIYDVFLFDQAFDIHRLGFFHDKRAHAKTGRKKFKNAIANASHWTSGKSTLCFKNMNGVYHFRTKSEYAAKQFERSILLAKQNSIWCQENRFKSFAPIRDNTPTTWYVDGRDYFWDVSVALENAKECIYIHDWWLSPELFLRRPAAQHLEWRLDRVLRRKADQGIKVYIVMYKEVAMALPLFSHQAKRHLLSLSPNIFVQRHPSRALDVFNKDMVFFWAHHEKICVVDHEVAFIGGIDQCFGRWDTPAHQVVDDASPELDPSNTHPQIWPGKDYSNPRIIDFHTLDKPFEDNQDRTLLPRMPWHDMSMRIVGPSARDVARHFIQRWNFLRRKKPAAPKRPTPMLVPPPDTYIHQIGQEDARIGHPHLSTSCRVQILRSVSPWSIGSIDYVEHSIQTAYIESIRDSNYLVYIENQFFVTSTQSGNAVIENKIGDALFERIVRAHQQGKKWRAIIIIPLVPGFPANIDETEATTVRIIMQCQYFSVARGPHSLLARLHDAGVLNTHEYINFYGLRNWGKLNGQYVTEQVYIHAKTMIVDDKTVIMGSANINERSMLGTRDSEIAACIQDEKNLVETLFDNVPVKVSRFAHTLRMRLMCEHIGLDVDRMDRERYTQGDYFQQPVWSDCHLNESVDCVPPYIQVTTNPTATQQEKDQIQQEEQDVLSMSELEDVFSDSSDSSDSNGPAAKTQSPRSSVLSPAKSVFHKRKSTKEDYLDFWTSLDPDTDNNGDRKAWQEFHATGQTKPEAKALDTREFEPKSNYYSSARLDPLDMENKTVGDVYQILQDPLADTFQVFWHMLARINTDLFRRCFLVTPDNNVRNWDQYHHYNKMAKLFLGRVDIKHGGTKTTAAAANVTALPLTDHEQVAVRQVLAHIRGHLVIWPHHFMEQDDEQNQFLFNVDKFAPLEIFD